MDKLLYVKTEKRLTACDESSQLAEGFLDFFVVKITKIRNELQSRSGVVNPFTDLLVTPLTTLN